MTRSLSVRAVAVPAVVLLLTGSSVAAAAPVRVAAPSPTVEATWPAPGDRAESAEPRDLSADVATVQLVRKPLDAVEEDVEAGATASFTLSADVLFDTGKDTLSPDAEAALENLAESLKEAGVAGPATVAGHTDDVGEDAGNADLSQRRAQTVSTRLAPLLENTGITLQPQGFGETVPLVPNADDASRARNRRVSVVFTGAQPTDGSKRKASDIAVNALETAPPAPATGAPEGSLVATQRTIAIGDDAQEWTIRLDVTRSEVVDQVLVVETRARVVAGPDDDDFADYGGLFNGVTYEDDPSATQLYDVDAAQRLSPVITGAGTVLGADFSGSIDRENERLGWLMFPLPEGDVESVPLYVPAFGVLTVPVAR